jgi:dihydroorotate dehydrogenase (fumarate)
LFAWPQGGRKPFLGRCTVQILRIAGRPNARLLPALVAAAVALGVVLASAPAHAEDAPPTDEIGIAAQPVSDDGPIRTRFDYTIGPGQTLDDGYVVTNRGTGPQTFTVYATDAFNTDEGAFGLLDTGVAPTDAGSWVTFSGAPSVQVTLQPAETTTIPFTVRAPDDATPGDHAGGIVASVQSPDGQVIVDRRLGTRLYARVPGDLQPALTIAGISASYTPSLNPFSGDTTVTFTVRNAGNVALAGDLKAEVRGLFGIGLSAPIEQEVSEMLPGSTRTITTTVSGVGQWVYLNPGVTVYPKVDESAQNPGPLTSVSRDTVLFVVPWLLVALIILGLLIWGGVRFSRRRNDKRAQEWMDYAEAEARRKAESEREPVSTGSDA